MRKSLLRISLPSERDREFWSSVFYKRSAIFLLPHTAARRPPHITGLRVNTVPLEWVGVPNERAPFRVHDAVIGFVGQYLRRDLGSPTRVLGFHENCSGLASAKYVRIDVYVCSVSLCRCTGKCCETSFWRKRRLSVCADRSVALFQPAMCKAEHADMMMKLISGKRESVS